MTACITDEMAWLGAVEYESEANSQELEKYGNFIRWMFLCGFRSIFWCSDSKQENYWSKGVKS
jgi:hypothetical protein